MKNQLEYDTTTQALDIIFKMRRDGRMDEEEAGLLINLIFGGHLDDEAFDMLKFIYAVRPSDELWPFGKLQVAPKIHYLDDLK